MEVNAINGYTGIRFRGFLETAEKRSERIIENRDSNGDNQLNVEELGKQPGILKQIDATGDNVVSQSELFAALKQRIEEKNNISIDISVNINVLKASLGQLLSSALNQSNSVDPTNLATDISADDNRLNSNANERYINSLITAGADVGDLFGSSNIFSTNSAGSNIISPYATNQSDGNQLLLDLLIEELETPRQDAIALISVLQAVSFQTVA